MKLFILKKYMQARKLLRSSYEVTQVDKSSQLSLIQTQIILALAGCEVRQRNFFIAQMLLKDAEKTATSE